LENYPAIESFELFNVDYLMLETFSLDNLNYNIT